jgi:aspartyl-tRNA(Asn)/glutamyl-tRNA(Gln) amidotransferase subunit A
MKPSDGSDLTGLTALTATELLARFRAGDATPSAAVEAALERIAGRDAAYHAFRTVVADAARAAAASSDTRWRRGEPRALEGIPFAVKDNVDTEGVLTTAGTARFADRVPVRNATVVQRLLDAGAILIGKTVTPELAFGDAIEDHRAVNPWDLARWTGGSSSGSAVALAAREVPLAVGTDTGGSIRVPASYCGVCGLKPTLGSIPRDGVVPVSTTLDQLGPMGRTVDDVALMWSVMADGTRPTTDRPLRIGVPSEWFFDWGTPDVLDAVRGAVDRLRDHGARIEPVSLPAATTAGLVAWTITVAEFAACYGDGPLDDLTDAARARIAAGAELTAVDYVRALEMRASVIRQFDEAFGRVDAIVTPATPTVAPRVAPTADPLFDGGDEVWLERIARNFLIANVAGIPALVVPVAISAGLPVGAQVLAAPGGEETGLQVGRWLELDPPASGLID